MLLKVFGDEQADRDDPQTSRCGFGESRPDQGVGKATAGISAVDLGGVEDTLLVVVEVLAEPGNSSSAWSSKRCRSGTSAIATSSDKGMFVSALRVGRFDSTRKLSSSR
jgi:hypothetical protein